MLRFIILIAALTTSLEPAFAAPPRCTHGGCDFDAGAPRPAAFEECWEPSTPNAVKAAVIELVEGWLVDGGAACAIDESSHPPRLTVDDGGRAPSRSAALALVRPEYQAWARSIGHAEWAADFERIAYDFCKKVGRDQVKFVVKTHCGVTQRFAMLRYVADAAGDAERARQDFFVRMSQPWQKNDTAVGDPFDCTGEAGEYCAYVDPNYVRPATTAANVTKKLAATATNNDLWRTANNTAVTTVDGWYATGRVAVIYSDVPTYMSVGDTALLPVIGARGFCGCYHATCFTVEAPSKCYATLGARIGAKCL